MKLKPGLVLLVLLIALLISSPALAQTGIQSADPVILTDGQEKYALGLHLEILKDSSGELTIQDVSSQAFQEQFTPSQDETPNFGYQRDVFWVRFRVHNQAEQNNRWVLQQGFANMHYMDLYQPSADGTGFSVKKSGVMQPFINRDYPFYLIAFNLDLPPGSEETIYIRFQNQASMTLPLTLWSQTAFTKHMLLQQLFQGGYYGILLIMALYNIVLWRYIQERTYLYLVFFIVSWIAFYIFYDAFVYQFIPIRSPRVATTLLLLFFGSSILFTLKFVVELLDLKTLKPNLYSGFQIISGLFILSIVMSPFVEYRTVVSLQVIFSILIFLAIIGLSLNFLQAGSRPARFLLVSGLLFLIGALLGFFARFNIIPSTPFTEGLNRIGMIWMVAVWSLALADRVNTLKAAAETANRQLSESQEMRHLAFDGARLGIWSNNLETGEAHWDARTREIFGVKPDETATQKLGFSLIHPEDRGRAQIAFARAIAPQSDGIYEDEYRIVRPDREVGWIYTKGNAVFEGQDTERRGTKLAGIVMDVTERNTSKRTLEESEARYRTLVEIMNEGLGVTDENNRFVYVNPRLAEMLGYEIDEMIEHPIAGFLDEENREIIQKQLQMRRMGEKEPYTLTWLCKDGSDLHTLIAPAAVLNDQGEYLQSIAVVTDISEQVKAKQQVEQRVAERTHQLSTVLGVSQVVASNLELKPLLKVILEQLRSVIDFDGAAIVSLADRQLTTLNFPLQIGGEDSSQLIQSIFQALQDSTRMMRDDPIFITDILADTTEGREFRQIASSLFGAEIANIHSWMGVPLRVKQKLVGILSIHHSQPGYYTPVMGELAHAFANQAAIAIENARLYQQARFQGATEERNRLAGELHDSVTQSLYSLTLYTEATRLALGSGKVEKAQQNLREVLTLAREGMADLRLLIFELRPPILEQEGLIVALKNRLEAVEGRAGCHADFHVEGEPDLSPKDETDLYWAIHEALNNVLKHARAENVFLILQFQTDATTITLRDDGVGFNPNDINSLSSAGLKNIAQRVERMGGRLMIESKPGQGTVIQIKVEQRDD